ncbi:hypothetical protein AK812_SmicGene39225 [Symbiodinium microadriaticum]|uniref:Reverse transcriptase domain-containing protein n=1 Tax=Symbiodinium microadriaticum TaxID=2951 RepID=A0A1Q9CBT2_SYMMI|nr:hypothetical protein AK812_SmicGene39225 [Symbiodinium microadriaticum]
MVSANVAQLPSIRLNLAIRRLTVLESFNIAIGNVSYANQRSHHDAKEDRLSVLSDFVSAELPRHQAQEAAAVKAQWKQLLRDDINRQRTFVKAGSLYKMPLAWWAMAAELWSHVWSNADVPKAWKYAKVTLIRKKGGPSTRPITLTQTMWRIGAKCVARALRQWAPEWASESDHGGLPGRSISDVLFQVQASLHRGASTAALMDVAGYFDAMNATMLRKIFTHLGAPVQLAPLLESFYSGAYRYFCFEGSFDPEYHVVHSGIAQGCPLSPIAAAAVSHCWSEYIKASCRHINVQIFMDDRTLLLEPSLNDAADRTAKACVERLSARLQGQPNALVTTWKLVPLRAVLPQKKAMTTKFPSTLVLMELAEELSAKNCELQLQWIRRDLNQLADDLTNENFASFDPNFRIDLKGEALEWRVLGRLLRHATSYFEELGEVKRTKKVHATRFAKRTRKLGTSPPPTQLERYRANPPPSMQMIPLDSGDAGEDLRIEGLTSNQWKELTNSLGQEEALRNQRANSSKSGLRWKLNPECPRDWLDLLPEIDDDEESDTELTAEERAEVARIEEECSELEKRMRNLSSTQQRSLLENLANTSSAVMGGLLADTVKRTAQLRGKAAKGGGRPKVKANQASANNDPKYLEDLSRGLTHTAAFVRHRSRLRAIQHQLEHGDISLQPRATPLQTDRPLPPMLSLGRSHRLGLLDRLDRLERRGFTWTQEEVDNCVTMEQFLDYLEVRGVNQPDAPSSSPGTASKSSGAPPQQGSHPPEAEEEEEEGQQHWCFSAPYKCLEAF